MIPKKEGFECSHCSYCCTLTVLLSDKEISRIVSLGYKERDFVDDYGDKKIIKQKNNYCHFLHIENGLSSCSIHAARPLPCKQYPFFETHTAECEPKRIFDVEFGKK